MDRNGTCRGQSRQRFEHENPDLFLGAASSFGTLGVTTLLKVQLMEAKKYVELTYHPVSGMSEAIQKIEETTKDSSNDYLDGILFARDSGVVCTGHLTDFVKENIKIQRFSRAKDPWFYLHAEKMTRGYASLPTTET